MIPYLPSVLCLCSVTSIFSFSTVAPITAVAQHPGRSKSLTTVGSSSSDTVEEGLPQRRAVLSFIFATATLPLDYLALKQYEKSQQLSSASQSTASSPSPLITDAKQTDDSFTPVSNLEEALRWIENSVDPRFLHAVVASDYQCFYQEGSRLGLVDRFPETPTTGSNDVFSQLERNQLRDRPVQPGRSQLLVSNLDVARKKWGGNDKNIVTVWPMMERTSGNKIGDSSTIHYAWPENGGVFLENSSIIVDGIDCGRMSLEDALEGDMEVLIQAKQFLVIPLSMEQKLVQKLRGAFLI